jgi:hypothetical protein
MTNLFLFNPVYTPLGKPSGLFVFKTELPKTDSGAVVLLALFWRNRH